MDFCITSVDAASVRPLARVTGVVALLAGLAMTGTACTAIAQSPPPVARQQPSVAQLMERMGHRVSMDNGRAKGSRELHLRWNSPAGALTDLAGGSLGVVRQQRRSDPAPRQRSAEVTADQIVVVVFDKQGTVRYSRTMADPRVVIGEFPDAEGKLHRSDVLRTEVPIDLTIPDSIDPGEIHVFKPGLTSAGEMQLTPLVNMPVPEMP